SIDLPIERKKIEPFEFKRGQLCEIVFGGQIFSSGLEDRVEAQRVRARLDLRGGKIGVRREGIARNFVELYAFFVERRDSKRREGRLEAFKMSFLRVHDYRLNAETRDVGFQ